MREVVELGIVQFSAVYLLLIVVVAIMKHAKINQTKLLIVASFRMTIQLILAGLVLTYIFDNQNPLFTTLYLLAMTGFTIKRTLGKKPWPEQTIQNYCSWFHRILRSLHLGLLRCRHCWTESFQPAVCHSNCRHDHGQYDDRCNVGLKIFFR